jgi:prepilin-type N-terminal cleavage/methylation domain-containing protein
MKNNRSDYLIIRNKKGITLIEVLIAMTIFAVGFLGIGKIIGATLRNNTTGHTMTRATMLAQEKIETLKLLSLDGMKAQCPADRDPEKIDTIFERRCRVDITYTGGIHIIEVTVSWQHKDQTREVVLKTLTLGDGT